MAGDTTAEPSETFTVTLTTPVNVSFARAVATGTIQNDDGAALPSLGISDVTQAEGNAGTTTFTFTVSLSFASTQVVTVQFASIDGAGAAGAISGGSASSGGRDYDASNGTVSFAIGETSKTISITVNGDLLDEDAESFQVVLSGAVNAVIADAIGVGTISNDDTAPTIVINSVSVTEGATGVRPATFTATLSGPSGRPVSVNYASADGSATAGGVAGSGGQDYAAALGSISFAPGQTTQTISVIVNGDTLDEADETFTVTLSSPVNATLGTPATGTGTITDDDAPPALLISDTRVIEGNTGMATLNFTVGLTAPSGQTVTVQYASADGSATLASSDYMQASGTLTFAPGTSTTQLVAVQVVGDTMTEGNENLTVTLSSPVNATITRATGTGTIINDDGALPIIGISNGQTNEGGMVTFTLVLSMPSATPVTVQYATQDGSATDGADYTAASGTVTFPAGQQMQQVMITTLQDGLDEANETFTVNLSSASGNASIGVGTGTGTIIDNDDQPSLAINDSSVTEGNSGTTVATFTVTLSAASGRTVTVNYSTANGTAQSGGTLAAGGQDYVSTSGTLSFAPGETSKTIMVTINGDTTFEQTERYGVLLAGASNASVSDGQGQGTITNDDTQPTLSINDVAHAEGTGATPTAFVFTVTLSNPSVQTVTVTFNTMAGTAAQFGVNADLLPQLGQLSFPPGVTTQTITVNVLADAVTEQDETFSVVLSMPMGATITDNSGLGTIGNDD